MCDRILTLANAEIMGLRACPLLDTRERGLGDTLTCEMRWAIRVFVPPLQLGFWKGVHDGGDLGRFA